MGYHLSLSMNSPLITSKNYLCGLLCHRFFIKNIFTRFKVGYQVCLMPAMQFVLYDNIFTKSEKEKRKFFFYVVAESKNRDSALCKPSPLRSRVYHV